MHTAIAVIIIYGVSVQRLRDTRSISMRHVRVRVPKGSTTLEGCDRHRERSVYAIRDVGASMRVTTLLKLMNNVAAYMWFHGRKFCGKYDTP